MKLTNKHGWGMEKNVEEHLFNIGFCCNHCGSVDLKKQGNSKEDAKRVLSQSYLCNRCNLVSIIKTIENIK